MHDTDLSDLTFLQIRIDRYVAVRDQSVVMREGKKHVSIRMPNYAKTIKGLSDTMGEWPHPRHLCRMCPRVKHDFFSIPNLHKILLPSMVKTISPMACGEVLIAAHDLTSKSEAESDANAWIPRNQTPVKNCGACPVHHGSWSKTPHVNSFGAAELVLFPNLPSRALVKTASRSV